MQLCGLLSNGIGHCGIGCLRRSGGVSHGGGACCQVVQVGVKGIRRLCRLLGAKHIAQGDTGSVCFLLQDRQHIPQGLPGGHKIRKRLTGFFLQNGGGDRPIFPKLVEHTVQVCGGFCRCDTVFCHDGIGAAQSIQVYVKGPGCGDDLTHCAGQLSNGGFA